jgi:cytochrome P450 family 4
LKNNAKSIVPEYKTALLYPGGKIYPIVGQLFELLGLNREELFKFLRNNAMKYKKSYRFYFLGQLDLVVIRANEVEVAEERLF